MADVSVLGLAAQWNKHRFSSVQADSHLYLTE